MIFWKKKSNFAGFAETNSQRKWPILWKFSSQISPNGKEESKEERFQKKNILEGFSNSGQERKHKSSSNTVLKATDFTCFERQEKHKLNRNVWLVNLHFQLQFRAKHSNTINFFSLLALLCCFAVYKARLLVIEGSNPFVKSKHSCVFDRVLHVRLNMCLHYYRQQFPFTLIVSTKILLISCAQFFATLI